LKKFNIVFFLNSSNITCTEYNKSNWKKLFFEVLWIPVQKNHKIRVGFWYFPKATLPKGFFPNEQLSKCTFTKCTFKVRLGHRLQWGLSPAAWMGFERPNAAAGTYLASSFLGNCKFGKLPLVISVKSLKGKIVSR